jgi:SAM-dependent methyltransferase
MALFGSKAGGGGARAEMARVARRSSGWMQTAKDLRAREGLRVLDIGPTSAGNINYITMLGHSVYMANLVDDAARPEFRIAPVDAEAGAEPGFDVEQFLKQNLDFSGRVFDVILLWDTLDYLPTALLEPIVERLRDVMEPGGQLLAFFHSKQDGDDTAFSRYHLTDGEQVELQRTGTHKMQHTFTNRQIEGIFKAFAGYKFLLAKDSLREVIVTR